MKKFFYAITLFLLSTVCSNLKAQNNCAVITVEPEANSQTGIYRVKVSLDRSYDQAITVNGVIRDETNLSTETPFSVTVPNGNTTAATDYFFEIGPEGDLNWIVNTITPSMVTKNGVNYGTQGLLGACFGEVTSSFLAADNDFIQYANAHNNVSDTLTNIIVALDSSQYVNFTQQLDYFNAQGTLTEQETTDFSSLIGFTSVQALKSYVDNTNSLLSNLKSKYSVFQSIDLETSQTTITSAYNILYPLFAPIDCEARYKNCILNSKAIYILEVAGCTAGAATFGAFSFGTLGVAFQLICGGAAITHRSTMIKECGFQREDCENSK